MRSLIQRSVPLIALFCSACAQVDSQPTPDVVTVNDRGVAKMGQYQYVSAHEDFSFVVAQAPNWEVGLVNLAIATLNRQQPDDELLTLEILQQVLAINPSNVRAQYTSGIVNLYLGQTDESIVFLEKAMELDSEDAFTAYFLGQAHLQSGNYNEAQRWLLKTLELNNAIRSAYWAAATASRRLDDLDKATQLIEQYQSFEHNPLSVNASFSYKQMGPKAEARSITQNVVVRSPKPTGALFGEVRVLEMDLATSQTISSFDLNHDDVADLLISDLQKATFVSLTDTGPSQLPVNHAVAPHMASAWGDMDNNGTTELITCNNTGVHIQDMSDQANEMTHIASPQCDLLRVLDTDHDGDLDILVGGTFGLSIFHNDLNGNYVAYEPDASIGFSEPIRQVLIDDIDRDRDADLVLVGHGADNRAIRNELTWRYEIDESLAVLNTEKIKALVSIDSDVDGRVELIAATEKDELVLWDDSGATWQASPLNVTTGEIRSLDVNDFDGDGLLDLLVVHSDGFSVLAVPSGEMLAARSVPNVKFGLSVYTDPLMGASVVLTTDSAIHHFPPGPGRYPFLAVSPTGKSSADQMRSNASGIGTYLKLRADTRWSLASNFPQYTSASQSLMPTLFGSGGADKADYLEILWSDGVTQSEIELAFGEKHDIDEIQRQLASCPVVFVWNGEKYEFLSDVLGVAALGYFAEPGVNSPVRPYERILLPPGMLQPRNGKFEVKIGEPMEEVLYLDSAALLYFDVPEGWAMVLDERLNVQSEQPTSEPIFYREVHKPVSVMSNVDGNALTALAQADRKAVNPGAVDPRFLGLLADEHMLTLEFDTPLPKRNAVLVAEGWVEFPYSQTSFATYQANHPFQAPTLEVRDGEGSWHVVASEFGFPAGMPRQMVLPLPPLPNGAQAIRLTTNLELYWDRIRVVQAEPLPQVKTQRAEFLRGIAKSTGYAKRTTGPQRTPYYDYDHRTPHWDAKFASGFYSALGPVTPLVEATDSSVAIVGSGEEIHLEFKVPDAPGAGQQRYYALDFRGWAKDMDLYTSTGDRVEPIPSLPNLSPEEETNRATLHASYNVRYQSGMAAR